MVDKKADILREQYEDSAMGLLLRSYEEDEGEALLREFEEAKSQGKAPQISPQLNKRCSELVARTFRKQQATGVAGRVAKKSMRVAVYALAAVGIVTTMAVSVDAIREPLFQFISDRHSEYSLLSVSGYTHADALLEFSDDPLGHAVPEEYSFKQRSMGEDDVVTFTYANDSGATIQYLSYPTVSSFDSTMGSTDKYTNAMLNENVAFFIAEDNDYQVFWYNLDYSLYCKLISTDSEISFDDFWAIAETTATACERYAEENSSDALDLLKGELPAGYTRTQYSPKENNAVMVEYSNIDGARIRYASYEIDYLLSIDTENAEVSTIVLKEYEATLVEKENFFCIYWIDEEDELIRELLVKDEAFTLDRFMSLAKNIAEKA